MKETSARLLRLLTLLQTRRDWSGADLADRLGDQRAHPPPRHRQAASTACRDHQCLRFDYRGHHDAPSVRVTEPHQLVTWGRRWYLVAWDTERDAWRTFRVDRMRPRVPTGPRFAPRDLPGDDAAAFVARGVAQLWPYQATVRLHTPAKSAVAQRCATYGRIEPIDAHTCLLRFGADTPHALAFLLGMVEVDFDLQDPPELAEQLLRIADRYRRAVGRALAQ